MSDLEQLCALDGADHKLDALRRAHARLDDACRRHDGELADLRRKFDEVRATHHKHQQREKAIEAELSALDADVRKLASDRDASRSSGAYEAINREITNREERRGQLEDEGLRLLEILEKDVADTARLERALKDKEDALGGAELEREKTLAADAPKLSAATARRQQLFDALGGALADRYDEALRTNGFPALARIEDGCCKSCGSTLPAQLYHAAVANGLPSCPGCRRLLTGGS